MNCLVLLFLTTNFVRLLFFKIARQAFELGTSEVEKTIRNTSTDQMLRYFSD